MEQNFVSPYKQVDTAYRRGQKDWKKGISRKENPYPDVAGSLTRRVCGAWTRGWLAASRGSERSNVMEKQ